MKIEFDIPEWALARTIYIFAGRELLGIKETHVLYDKNKNKHIRNPNIPIKLKTSPDFRCDGCGDCCSTGGSPFSEQMLEDIKKRLKDYIWQGTGTKCPLLGEQGCIMKGSIPFSCAKSNCEGWSENCTEKLIPINEIEVL